MTWDNGCTGNVNVQECLDRVVVNLPWLELFQQARVSSLDFRGSHHKAIKISLGELEPGEGQGDLKF